MRVAHSKNCRPKTPDAEVGRILREVRHENLQSFVEMLAFPRHYFAERQANRRARDLLVKCAMSFGYAPVLQGSYDNIVLTSGAPAERPLIMLGAHYDSVPRTPGADDKAFGHLNRSDHAPFWKAGIPSIMWTDTSEFRNPHYHLASDAPDTLDYDFMSQVARLALARVARPYLSGPAEGKCGA